MAKQQKHESPPTECEQVAADISKKVKTLEKWRNDLDDSLNYSDKPNLDHITKLTAIVDRLEKDLMDLQIKQQKLGCYQDEKPLILNDSQSILSGGTVRRKNADALKIVEADIEIGYSKN